MNKARAVVTFILFLASLGSLLGAHSIADLVLRTYSESHIQSFGPRVPAFSVETVAYMRNGAFLCFGTATLSLGLAVLAWFRSATREAGLGWIAILSAFNYYVSFILVSAIAIGFFALPKLANGA